jgi:hypothetical protein
MAGITYTKATTAPPPGGIAIGDPVTGGNPDSVLYSDGANNLNNSTDFRFDDVLHKFTTPDVNLLANEINFTDGHLKSNGAGTLDNNFFYNFFATGPLGLGTLLQASVFTLEKVRIIEQSFFTSVPVESRIGSFTMVAGVGTFAALWITAAHKVFISPLVNDPFSHGNASVVITAGVGVTITSSNPLDTTSYNIIIFNTF